MNRVRIQANKTYMMLNIMNNNKRVRAKKNKTDNFCFDQNVEKLVLLVKV